VLKKDSKILSVLEVVLTKQKNYNKSKIINPIQPIYIPVLHHY